MLRGGLSIAAGSDGCVFDGTFVTDGKFTKDPTRVTKVYLPEGKDVADNEWKAMELVMKATGGEGVVVAEGPPQLIDVIPEPSFEDDTDRAAGRSGYGKAACEKLVDELLKPDSNGKFPGLVLPRIDGTVLDLYIDEMMNNRRLVLPEESFAKLVPAVAKMGEKGIVHMDFAIRNVFYKKEGAVNTLLLGDFGNTFKLGGSIDKDIQDYITRYNFRGVGKFLACAKVDGVHPLAIALMILYDAFLAGEDVYEKLLNDEIRKDNYLNRCKAIAESTWVAKSLRNLAGRDPSTKTVVEEFINTLASKLKTVIGIFAAPGRGYAEARDSKSGIENIIQKTLKRSDKCLLDVMILMYQKDALSSASITNLTQTWFPPPPPKPGGKQRGGDKMLIQADSLEAVLAQPDPKLTDDPSSAPDSFPPLTEGLKQLEGGVRKSNKTRRNRVKMSRRK